MAGLTLAQKQANLDAANAALQKAMSSSSYSIAGRSVSRQSMGELQDAVKYWEGQVKRHSKGTGIPVHGVNLQ